MEPLFHEKSTKLDHKDAEDMEARADTVRAYQKMFADMDPAKIGAFLLVTLPVDLDGDVITAFAGTPTERELIMMRVMHAYEHMHDYEPQDKENVND